MPARADQFGTVIRERLPVAASPPARDARARPDRYEERDLSRSRGRIPIALVAFGGYLLVSFCYFGVPVLTASGRPYVGSGLDPEIFIWAFAWWPHALLHGENPFYTHALWVPTGYNLAFTATAPGVAIMFAPVTLLVGAAAAYNIAAVALPALAAWTAYLLCRYLTGKVWPSLVGGYLFGFSSYMLGQEEGHLHMTSVFLLPLIALLVVRYVDGNLLERDIVVRLGLLLGLQCWFSLEVFATASVALATAVVVAGIVSPAIRPRLRSLVVAITGAYLIAAVLVSPLLYSIGSSYGTTSLNLPEDYSSDLLNTVIPTGLSLSGAHWATALVHFPTNDAEAGGYLGLPTLVILVLFARRRWRTPGGRFLLASVALALVASFGTAFYVGGHRVMWLPWTWLTYTVPFDNVLPVRLSLYVSLASSVIIAIWMASSRHRIAALLLPVLAVLAVVPMLGHGYWKTTPVRPRFFTTGLERSCLRPRESILAIPYNNHGDSMLWQAESNFRFRLAEGYVTVVWPQSYRSSPDVFPALQGGDRPPSGPPGKTVAFARSKGVSIILVSQQSDQAGWARYLATAIRPRRIGGVYLFPIRKSSVPAGCRATA